MWDEVVYEASFGIRDMNKGELAVARLMLQAVENGEVVASKMQAWHEV